MGHGDFTRHWKKGSNGYNLQRSWKNMKRWKNRIDFSEDVVFFSYLKEISTDFSEIYVWDLDKTYLDTRWHTLGEILRFFFEKSFQKKNIPGTSTLVCCLKESWKRNSGFSQTDFPIFFVTASPPQMEEEIRKKMEMDKILPQGIFFKNNLKNIYPNRWRYFYRQVGYKLEALMRLRTHFKGEITQVLWGDDSEMDATIYSLYSDICARRWKDEELFQLFKHFNVNKEQCETIFDLQAQCPDYDPVEKVYINLALDTDPEYYLKFGRRILPIYNSFQTSLDLFQDGRLQQNHILRVAQDLMVNYGFTTDQLQNSLDDLVRRRILAQETLERILSDLQKEKIVDWSYSPSVVPGKVKFQVGERVFSVEGETEPWIPEQVDYIHDYR